MEQQKTISTTVIMCRSTGFGAFTSIVETNQAHVKKVNISKTGNHWEEHVLFQTPESWVLVQDISNSGKHTCYRLYADLTQKRAACSGHCPM